jgi:hypothetical protein
VKNDLIERLREQLTFNPKVFERNDMARQINEVAKVRRSFLERAEAADTIEELLAIIEKLQIELRIANER